MVSAFKCHTDIFGTVVGRNKFYSAIRTMEHVFPDCTTSILSSEPQQRVHETLINYREEIKLIHLRTNIEDMISDLRNGASQTTTKVERTYRLMSLPSDLVVLATSDPNAARQVSLTIFHQKLDLRVTLSGQLNELETLFEKTLWHYNHQEYDIVEVPGARELLEHHEAVVTALREEVTLLTITYKLTGSVCTGSLLTIDYDSGNYGGWGKLNEKTTSYQLGQQSARALVDAILVEISSIVTPIPEVFLKAFLVETGSSMTGSSGIVTPIPEAFLKAFD